VPPPRLIAEVAREEQRASSELLGADDGLVALLAAVVAGSWQAPTDGITLDPYDTVAAVLDCVLRASSLRDGLLRAVDLGGDTDTVAALTGGLLGAQHMADQVRTELPWHDMVLLPERDVIARLATALASLRAA
jgi:ADP-ribosyl-[dinitrogen reductase] hydrolase